MIQLRIKELLKSKGVAKGHAWLCKRGISHSMSHLLYSGKYESIQLEHINIICRSLNCTPNDLFAWTPDAQRGPVSPEHKLHSIAPREPSRILDLLKKMTEAEIKEWERKMREGEDGDE